MKVIATENAPAAVGPYSQATAAKGTTIFLSGQIPLDPATGQMVEGDIEAQTDRVLKNLGAVLEAAGCSFADVVRTTIYLSGLCPAISSRSTPCTPSTSPVRHRRAPRSVSRRSPRGHASRSTRSPSRTAESLCFGLNALAGTPVKTFGLSFE